MNPANDNRQETSNVPSGALGLSLVSAHDPISKIERPTMKTKISTTGRIVGFAITVALFAVTTVAGNSQDKGLARGATRLMQLNAPKTAVTVTTTDYKPMACAHCKDSAITVRDSDARGAGARSLVSSGATRTTIAKHLCGACGNEWVVSGSGKATTFLPVHTCASCL